jgi:hypothetical protein
MTELERLLVEQLSVLSTQHEQQFKLLSDAQQQQAQRLEALSRRVVELTRLLQN